MIPLYPDQTETLTRLRQSLKTYKRVLLQAATGWGKSIGAADMISGAQRKNRSSLFTVPRRQLVDQMAENFRKFDISHGYVVAGYPEIQNKTLIATLDTLENRDIAAPDVIFYDETHYDSEAIERIQKRFPAAYSVGLSATPWLFSGRGLGFLYDTMISGLSVADLITAGRLSDYKYYAPSFPDLSALSIVDGEYVGVTEYMENKPEIIGDAVLHYQKYAAAKLGIAYCVSRKHSKQVAEQFIAAGIPACHVDAETSDDDRRRIFRDFALGKIKILTCAELLIFGFDLEAASGLPVTVEVIIDLAPSRSLAKQMQKWGRGLRRKAYPAIISDHAANWKIHGLPDFPREWTLKDRDQVNIRARDLFPLTRCPQCHEIYRLGEKFTCGHERVTKSRKIEYTEGDLKELNRIEAAARKKQIDDEKWKRKQEVFAAKTLEDLVAIGIKRGSKYPRQWAMHILKSRKRKK